MCESGEPHLLITGVYGTYMITKLKTTEKKKLNLPEQLCEKHRLHDMRVANEFCEHQDLIHHNYTFAQITRSVKKDTHIDQSDMKDLSPKVYIFAGTPS